MFSILSERFLGFTVNGGGLASLSPNIKSALKWNRGVCDFVMKSAIDRIVPKMTAKMEEIVGRFTNVSRV